LLQTFIWTSKCEHRAKSKDTEKCNEIMASPVNRTVEAVFVLNYLVHRATQIATRRYEPRVTNCAIESALLRWCHPCTPRATARAILKEGFVELKEVKMYSDYKSPYAYLAFDPAFALERRFRIRLRWIPFQLRIKGKGERSQYSEYKARYSYLDARRSAKPRGLLIRGPLKIFDTRPALIGGLYAQTQGRLNDYSRRAFELFFRREFEADQPDAVVTLIESLGMSGEAFQDYLAGAGVEAYEQAQSEAAADNIFGVPIFVFEREPFWGHDRIPVLEERLTQAGLALAPDKA
jgi:2-hydroxychromene-2-carboxylate isomerase